jgi:ribosomal protein S27E
MKFKTFVVEADLEEGSSLVVKCDDCGLEAIIAPRGKISLLDWECPNCPPTEKEDLPY